MNYLVKMTSEAEKEFGFLDKTAQKRVRERLSGLSLDPYDQRISKPLKMMRGKRSSRVGDWRILYSVDEALKVVEILAVRSRKEAY
jgi:mRNA interferase RelE/StbE